MLRAQWKRVEWSRSVYTSQRLCSCLSDEPLRLEGTLIPAHWRSNITWGQLTDSGGKCPALCRRGGRGRAWVTWRKGEPLVGRVDRHSHDAEWVRGAEWGGAEGVGEELGSSPKPETRQQQTRNGLGQNFIYIKPLIKSVNTEHHYVLFIYYIHLLSADDFFIVWKIKGQLSPCPAIYA